MVRVNEYLNNKRYIPDTKMGRRWRVPEGGEKEKQRKDRGEETGSPNTIQALH